MFKRILILAVIFLSIIFSYYVGLRYGISTTVQAMLSSSTPSPTLDTHITVHPLEYSRLNKIDTSQKTTQFYDPALGIKFMYPAEYKHISLEATADDLQSLSFFYLQPNKEQLNHAKDVLDCIKKNEPGSLCREGTQSDLDLFISRSRLTNTNSLPIGFCEQDKSSTANKLIYSCLTNGLSGEVNYEYQVEFKGASFQYFISMDISGSPYEHATLISSIISSLTAE